MNILIITSIYPEPSEYGIPDDSKAVHYFAKELVKMQHNVTVFHLFSTPISRVFSSKIRQYYLYESVQDGVRVILGRIQLLLPHKYCGTSFQQKRIAKVFLNDRVNTKTYDLIITHFPMTLLDFAITIAGEKKMSCVMHGVDLRELEKLKPKTRCVRIEQIVNASNVIAYRAKSLRQRAFDLGLNIDQSPVIYSGIPKTIVVEEKTILKKINKDFENKVIFAGKINKQKRVDLILVALAQTKTAFDCTIIGDGPEKKNMEKLSNNLMLNDRVHFLGLQKRERVSELMLESDLFVMVSQNETLGLVYLEAMAQGCIVIGTIGEGIDGIIKNGENGFLVPPNEPEKLAYLLDKIVTMPISERKAIQLNAYLTAMAMTDDIMAGRYIEYLASEDNYNVNGK